MIEVEVVVVVVMISIPQQFYWCHYWDDQSQSVVNMMMISHNRLQCSMGLYSTIQYCQCDCNTGLECTVTLIQCYNTVICDVLRYFLSMAEYLKLQHQHQSCIDIWYDVMWRRILLRDMTFLLHLYDVEYHVDYQTTTYHLLYLSISANTSAGWRQSFILHQQRWTCWGSETASRQRCRHRCH